MPVRGSGPAHGPTTEPTEDEAEAMLIRDRLARDNGNRTGLDDVLSDYGLTRADLEASSPDGDGEPGEEAEATGPDRWEAFRREYEELTDFVQVEVTATAATIIREHWVLKVPTNLWNERDTDPEPLQDWITDHYGDHGDCVDETNIGDEYDRQFEEIVGLYEPPAEPTPLDRAQRDTELARAIWSRVASVGPDELSREDRDRLERAIRYSSAPEMLADVIQSVLGGRRQTPEADA